ncbi:hypothetical protein IQ07DRAFT_604428 [Pyrenochaeta sp. DS3sAY3a]|nr:hypothetical protein IQ07DRAFT_604428 [Pyrenochaeta sp. DS3sAY3a]
MRSSVKRSPIFSCGISRRRPEPRRAIIRRSLQCYGWILQAARSGEGICCHDVVEVLQGVFPTLGCVVISNAPLSGGYGVILIGAQKSDTQIRRCQSGTDASQVTGGRGTSESGSLYCSAASQGT